MDPRDPTPLGNAVFTGRARPTSIRVPGVVGQAVALLILLGLAALGFLIFIPLAAIAITVFLIGFVVVWVRVKWRRARSPNGPLDGRRNVRVVRRE